MSDARPIRPATTYLVTRRTERRYCLLRPDPVINAFISYAFVISARRYGIFLHAFCAMSTHLHYVVTDPQGNLPMFMAMFHRLVALGVQKIRAWDGAVWDRTPPSIVELCTRQAIVEEVAYTLANPVEAGLVRYAREWPGVRTTVDDIGVNALDVRRPKHGLSAKNQQWALQSSLPISLPPSILPEQAQAFVEDIRTELENLEKAAHKRIPAKRVLGAKRATRVHPESRITSHEPARQRRPSFAVGRGNPEAFARAKKAKRDFRTAYKAALKQWRNGDRSVEFPAGTYAMRVLHCANVAEAMNSLGS